jgi:hypothetical protein
MTMTAEARTNVATEPAPLGGDGTAADLVPTQVLRVGTRLDVRPYFIGRYVRLMWIAAALFGAATVIAAIADVPQVWAFTLMPAIGMLLMAFVVTFDYATSDRDARPHMLTGRARK